MKRTPETGNALLFVLVAIALLAALTLTIARVSDTTESDSNVEQRRIQASEIMRFGAGIEQAVSQMRLRGISENDISFQNTITTADYTNANCTTNDCLVFGTGGGQTYVKPSAGLNGGAEWLFSGANDISNVGTTQADLVMILPNVNQELCARINTELGIAGVTQDAAKADISTVYAGAVAGTPETIDAAPGKKAACFQGNQDGGGADISANYYFYQVLIAR